MVDVLCLRPKADFDAVDVAPPEGLEIAYRGPADLDVADLIQDARALVIPAVGPALAPELFLGTQLLLLLVQVTGAGLDRVDRATLSSQGIALANVPGGSNAALAEYVTANALSLTRGFYAASGPLRAGGYAEHRAAMVGASLRGLGGLTVGLIGLGTIGLAVAQRCHAMGAKIAFHDPQPQNDLAALEMLGAVSLSLEDLLAASDIVSLHLPLLDSTRNLINAERIARMKPGAILINAARGGIVDEAALAEALGTGRLGGAAVDVFSTEPPAPDNPLLTLDGPGATRLILTPHIAGVSRQAAQHLFAEAWKNVARVLIDGQTPQHAVAAPNPGQNTGAG